MRRLILVVLLVALLGGVFVVVRWATPLLGASGAPSWFARTVYPLEHASVIRAAARDDDLDPALVSAVIYAESRFDAHARSPQGAVGLMQILPATAEQIAQETGGIAFTTADLEDPEVNVRYGCYYLRRALDTFDGDVRAAVASYNAGVGVVAEWRAAAAAAGHPLRIADIPYPETKAYVAKVLELRRVYRDVYGDRLRPAARPG